MTLLLPDDAIPFSTMNPPSPSQESSTRKRYHQDTFSQSQPGEIARIQKQQWRPSGAIVAVINQLKSGPTAAQKCQTSQTQAKKRQAARLRDGYRRNKVAIRPRPRTSRGTLRACS